LEKFNDSLIIMVIKNFKVIKIKKYQ